MDRFDLANVTHNKLMTEASSWFADCKDICTYFMPRRGKWSSARSSQTNPIDNAKNLNSTATKAVKKCASGFQSGMTNETRPWFKLGIEGMTEIKSEQVKEWLHQKEEILYSIMSRSNFYESAKAVYEETFCGQAAITMDENYETVVNHTVFTVGEYAIGRDYKGDPNRFTREFTLTCDQMVEYFGIENVSQNVRLAYNNNDFFNTFTVRHLIERNANRNPESITNKNMPWVSLYWEPAERTFLRETGYRTFPVICPSAPRTKTDETYAYGIAFDSIGDAKMLNEIERDKMIALKKIIEPPVSTDSDTDIVNTLPGGVTRTSQLSPNVGGLKPVYQINYPLQYVREEITEIESRIKDTFYLPLFEMMANLDFSQPLTATDVIQRNKEKLDMLAPVIQSYKNSFLNPYISRLFDICMDAGLFSEIPYELSGKTIKVDYISPLFLAMKMIETTVIEQTINFVGTISNVYPDAPDNIDSDKAIMRYANLVGSEEILRSPDAIKKIREDRQAAQAAEQQRADAAQALSGAKVASETPVGQNTVLDAMLQGAGAGMGG